MKKINSFLFIVAVVLIVTSLNTDMFAASVGGGVEISNGCVDAAVIRTDANDVDFCLHNGREEDECCLGASAA